MIESSLHTSFSISIYVNKTFLCSQTRSQLIKAGVKLLIQNKRKNSGSSCDAEQYQPEKIRVLSSSKITTTTPRTSSISFVTNESRPKKKKAVVPVKVNSSCDESSEDRFYSTSKLEVRIACVTFDSLEDFKNFSFVFVIIVDSRRRRPTTKET